MLAACYSDFMRIRHKGLRALRERDDAARLPAGMVPRLRRILFRLQEATHPGSADAPVSGCVPLRATARASGAFPSPATGALYSASTTARPWTSTLSTITDREGVLTMIDIAGKRVGPMQNPPYLGELIRESMGSGLERERDRGAARLRALNAVAPAERQGWGVREQGAGGHRLGHRRYHWIQMQASYELAQARRELAAAERRTSEWYA